MSVPKALAIGLAVSRFGFGLGYLLRPEQARASWIGRAARKPGTQVVAGHTVSDLADLVATWLARDDLPERRAKPAMAIAGAASVTGAAATAGLRPPPEPD